MSKIKLKLEDYNVGSSTVMKEMEASFFASEINVKITGN